MPTYEAQLTDLESPFVSNLNPTGYDVADHGFTVIEFNIAFATIQTDVGAGNVQFATDNTSNLISTKINVAAAQVSATPIDFTLADKNAIFTAVNALGLPTTLVGHDYSAAASTIRIVPNPGSTKTYVILKNYRTAGDQTSGQYNKFALFNDNTDITTPAINILPINMVHNCVGDQNEVLVGSWVGPIAACP